MFKAVKIAILVRRLKSKSKRKVDKARTVLISMKPERVVPSLLKHISLCDWRRHHIECLQTISSIRSPDLVPCLLYRLYMTDDIHGKIAIAISLGAVGNRDAVPPLVKLLSRRHFLIFLETRRCFPDSYASMDQFMATRPTLRELVETDKLAAWLAMLSTVHLLWEAVTIALGNIGDERAVAILEETLDDWAENPFFAAFHPDDIRSCNPIAQFSISMHVSVVGSFMIKALQSLAKIGGVHAKQVIQRYTEHGAEDVREEAVKALQSCSLENGYAGRKQDDELLVPLTEIVLDDAQESLDIRKTVPRPQGRSRCPQCGCEFDMSANIIAPPSNEGLSEASQVFLPEVMKLLDGEGYSMPHLRCPKCNTTWMEKTERVSARTSECTLCAQSEEEGRGKCKYCGRELNPTEQARIAHEERVKGEEARRRAEVRL